MKKLIAGNWKMNGSLAANEALMTALATGLEAQPFCAEPATAWISLAYLGAVAMYFGFFVWYAGLALGGIARVSQIQLLQPMLSLIWASIFLDEQLDAMIIIVALVVLVSVVGSRRSVVHSNPDVKPDVQVHRTHRSHR